MGYICPAPDRRLIVIQRQRPCQCGDVDFGDNPRVIVDEAWQSKSIATRHTFPCFILAGFKCFILAFASPVYCVVITLLLFSFSHGPDHFLEASQKLQVEDTCPPFFCYKTLSTQNSHSPSPSLPLLEPYSFSFPTNNLSHQPCSL